MGWIGGAVELIGMWDAGRKVIPSPYVLACAAGTLYTGSMQAYGRSIASSRPFRARGVATQRGIFALVLWVGLYAPIAVGADPLQVFVSILPQETFVDRIGGSRVTVQALVRPGQSPATYDPSARQMAALSEAALYVRTGVPFENGLMPRIRGSMPNLRIVDARHGITLRSLEGHDHGHEHEHLQDGGHACAADDPHIWLDPLLVKVQADTICSALVAIDPDGRAVYEMNRDAFKRDLDNLDARLRSAMAPLRGRTLMVFHPSWGYFADAYGLKQEAIEIGGKTPAARQLVRTIARAREIGVGVIFVQPQFDRKSAQTVAAAIGATVVPIDPLARDYMRNLETVAAQIEAELAP
jgi:zinc transport system substrate-binding protein